MAGAPPAPYSIPRRPPQKPRIISLRLVDRFLRFGDFAIPLVVGILVSWVLMGEQKIIQNVVICFATSVLFAQLLARRAVYMTQAHVFSIRLVMQLLQTLVFTFVVVTAIAFLLDVPGYTRQWILWWFAASEACIFVYRLMVTISLRIAMVHGRLQRRIAVYGGEEKGASIITHLLSTEDQHYTITGFYDDRANRVPDEIDGIPRLGGVDELIAAAEAGEIDEVVLALPLSPLDRLTGILNRLAGSSVTVHFAPDPVLWQFFDRPFDHIGGAPMLRALASPIQGWAAIAKFVEDRLIALVLIIMLLPVFAVISLAIWVETGKPILFRQPRRGWNGSLFTIYKFRTMKVDNEDLAGATQATRNDPRVTRVGRILRRTSLDELPQLLNVLNGDMSLVGPRPHALGTTTEGKPFEEAVQHYMVRYRVKPGITGWAQINGWRGETDTSQKLLGRVRYDIEYIENWSFWLDLYILMITPLALIVRSKNAY
ncbi:undecaprenyl-phosphate glucose phosphotransferase [Acuticoccus sp. I52.16.1]|uniref:undecaprenyl-phosphate glucose phosphotransferase n=1 Tax=Acuticoccus sp. I52.16.1 TaxID=2928472 RepID=UPI001FD54A8E|nr:undecaprenyl-phosphate glucose phosphotransferase [Acuticoccus sp. I52.16.1]UOM36017.1 undecaprenyl-phosphate glucose phosphotransferase [Acuticoccus sp. I52.16.1]